MKVYYCSLAVHILLEELGEPHQTEKVLTGDGSTRLEKHLAVKRLAKSPSIRPEDMLISIAEVQKENWSLESVSATYADD